MNNKIIDKFNKLSVNFSCLLMFYSNPASNMRTDLKQVEYQNRIALQRPSYNYEAKPLQENNHHLTQRTTKTPEDPSFQKTKSKIEEL